MIVKLWGCVNVCNMCSSLLSFHTSKSQRLSFSISLDINVYMTLVYIAKLIHYYLLLFIDREYLPLTFPGTFPLIIYT